MSLAVGGLLAALRGLVSPLAFGNNDYQAVVLASAVALVTSTLYSAGTTWLRVEGRIKGLATITTLDALWNIAAAITVVVTRSGLRLWSSSWLLAIPLALFMLVPALFQCPRWIHDTASLRDI